MKIFGTFSQILLADSTGKDWVETDLFQLRR